MSIIVPNQEIKGKLVTKSLKQNFYIGRPLAFHPGGMLTRVSIGNLILFVYESSAAGTTLMTLIIF